MAKSVKLFRDGGDVMKKKVTGVSSDSDAVGSPRLKSDSVEQIVNLPG